MLCSDFDYQLPDELIAQQPLAGRDQSRMMVLERDRGTWSDTRFLRLPEWLAPGDVVVVNNTRVFPARLIGHRILDGGRGAEVEALLISEVASERNEWEVVAKPGRILKPGVEIVFGNGELRGTVTEELDEGRRRIRFEPRDGDFNATVDRIGNTPLPPYIKRERPGAQDRLEERRYQTVFASERGAIAAPTAGLHFTEVILSELRARSIETVEITHHVGYATFQPIRVERVEDHRIGSESFYISAEAASCMNRRRAAGGRVIGVGTTTVRALESSVDEQGRIRAGAGSTDLFIFPGFRFRAIDGLLTNFHLPRSSLLMLVSAFGGCELVLAAYRHAVDQRYRFYSYGDCMLIV